MSKFKAGDRVVVTDGMYKSKLGIFIEESGLRFLVRLDEGFREVWIQANRLALLSQCEPAQDEVEPPTDAGTLTVSDPGVVTLGAPNKYARTIYPLEGDPVQIDVYRVLDAYRVTDQATAHAIKKLLMPGERGSKGVVQDLEEAAFSIKQAIELVKQKGGG